MPSRPLPPQQEILLRIAETGDALLHKLDDINQTLLKQNRSKQTRRRSTVEDFVAALLAKFPYRNWTSESLAKEIGNGCTSAAVRMTKQWKAYRIACRAAEKQHRNRSDIAYDNQDEIDERIDRETSK
jgi:hypothetical protein